MKVTSILAAFVGHWAAAVATAAASQTPAAVDFDNFEDNLAVESERSFATMNFDDFITSQFPAPDLRKLLAESGLFGGPNNGFGQRMGTDDAPLAGDSQQGNSSASSGGSVISQLLGSEDMHEELSDLLFGSQQARTNVPSSNTTANTADQSPPLFDGDRAEFADYDNADYDLYADFDEENGNDIAEERSDNDGDEPTAAHLRQLPLPQHRPYLYNRPRPQSHRKRYYPGGQPPPPPNRGQKQRPPRPGKLYSAAISPGLHRVPGRVQTLPPQPAGDSRWRPPQMQPHPNNHIAGSNDKVSDSAYSESFSAGPSIVQKAAGGLGSSDCDYFTDTLCLEVRNYPLKEITALLGANRRMSDDMIAEVDDQSADDLIDGVSSNQEVTYTADHYYGNNRREGSDGGNFDDGGQKHRDFASEGGFLCPSEIKYAKPKRGKTAQGSWKDIVNVNDYTQTLRMEKCLQPGGSCSYVSHHYKSQCSQVYNYHRLLSWDKERGLHMDIYKVPTCCSCHIMGYSYVYPPLTKGSNAKTSAAASLGFTPASSAANPSVAAPPPPPPPPVRTGFKAGPSAVQDNRIPDFNPQQELEQFMQNIGNDFKDFNGFGLGKRPVRQQPPPLTSSNNNIFGGSSQSRPLSSSVSGFNNDFRSPLQSLRNKAGQVKRRGDYSPANADPGGGRQVNPPMSKPRLTGVKELAYRNKANRRGDGFEEVPDGPNRDTFVPSPTMNGQQQAGVATKEIDKEDPGHKYESIPLDGVSEQEEEREGVVNYGYHPIIDFFNSQSYR